jgi:diguanylate cyclase (GGDEF)-like protein
LPALVLLGVQAEDTVARDLLIRLRSDGRLQTVPAVVALGEGSTVMWLRAGADEVINGAMDADEVGARLRNAARRSQRDIEVNPSSRLAGTDALREAISVRIERQECFAACYADLDHFKEFNDRYGYASGDDVIRCLAHLLVDVVESVAGADGFVGHIGGDDFLFLVPFSKVTAACDRVIQEADAILPSRYSAHDRQAGYFFGKDRRGRFDRVPLMTLSIGVATNERRRFVSAAQVSMLATEMKTYAKTLPGSLWAMDRRSEGEPINQSEEKLP